LKQTFTKAERLHEKKQMDRLFKSGKSFFVYPFKVFYSRSDEETPYPARVLISVPRRNFKKATDRNRIKRLVREAYRRNKWELCQGAEDKPCKKTLLIGLIYTPKVHLDYREIEQKIILILQRLQKKK
jgi:ribonuclease P protein component